MLQSLHALFRLLTTGSALTYCPQTATFAKALGTAARHDNGHIASLAASLALALQESLGRQNALTFLLALALTTHLKIALCTKRTLRVEPSRNCPLPELEPDHQRYFIRPVGNVNCSMLAKGDAASTLPGWNQQPPNGLWPNRVPLSLKSN